MALKKSDLYSSLWRSCDELRGGMDAAQYKDYILTLLFVKYVSDKRKSDPNSLIEVPDGGSFNDIAALKGKRDIGDLINKVIGALARANRLQGVIDLADFNDEEKLGRGKEMQDRLSALVTIFANLDFRGSRAEGDDLLGDAYEYLMRHFATESGKSKGQFYTPAEVSRVIASLLQIPPEAPHSTTVYDPTCGSGSLLIKVADRADRGLSIYGQEKDNATWALATMNMILHSYEDSDIAKGNTITSPEFTRGAQLRTFDFAVANPPFSDKAWRNGLQDDYGRFDGFGLPPRKNGDYAYLLHILASLKSKGRAAIVLPHGVLFRGHAEADIRQALLRRGYIKGVIGLPPNLFFGTGIPACLVVLDKHDAQARTGVFMVDASGGYAKDGAKNRLRSRDIHKIVDVFTNQTEVERYSRMVPLTEIERNDYNLNIPRYIDTSEPEDIQDLNAHLYGGVPDRDLDALGEYWAAFPSLRGELLRPNRPGYRDLAVELGDIQRIILDSAEFQKFASEVRARLADWFDAHRGALESIDANTRPNELISALSEDLLSHFRSTPLLDAYAVYEQLMAYWHTTMHDDVFLLMADGWVRAAKPRQPIDDKTRKISETPDLVIGSGRSAKKYKTDLIPPTLIVERYFPEQRAEVDALDVKADEAARAVDEYTEEHAVEDGLLADAMDGDKITKTSAKARLRQTEYEGADDEEVDTLRHLLELYNAESAAKREAKEGQAALDRATLKKYGEMGEAEVKMLVLDEKWHTTIAESIVGEVDALTLALVERIRELGNRYAETVGDLEAEVARLDGRVQKHLTDMGVE